MHRFSTPGNSPVLCGQRPTIYCDSGAKQAELADLASGGLRPARLPTAHTSHGSRFATCVLAVNQGSPTCLKAHIPFTFFTFVVVVSGYFLADERACDGYNNRAIFTSKET